MNLPRGKNFLTLTTTLTFPPGVGLAAPSSLAIGTTTPSRDRNDGLEAEDAIGSVDDIDEILLATVLLLMVDVAAEDVIDEREIEPVELFI